MTQTTFTKPDRYILCPACGKDDFSVGHLPIGTKTAWYCDVCGVRFKLHVLVNNEVECEVIEGERKEKRRVVLQSSGPVTLHLKTFTISPGDDEEFHAEYYYNEHTCPTNFMRDVVKVIDKTGDDDPHGVFKFVSIEPWVEKEE
jgi:rubredoxin